MTKSKKAQQVPDERLLGAAPAQTQETAVPEPAAAPAALEETPAADAADADPLHLIVLAHPGTEELLRRVWEKFYDMPLRVIPIQKGDTLASVLESIMAMEDVDRVFAVIPANLMPLAPVRWSELQLPRVYVNIMKRVHSFWGRVPVCFDKEILVDFLPEHSGATNEALAGAYVKSTGGRPEMVGHSFGNYLFNVLRGAPCEAVVIECMLRKRFLYANAVGWNAIADLIAKAFLG